MKVGHVLFDNSKSLVGLGKESKLEQCCNEGTTFTSFPLYKSSR